MSSKLLLMVVAWRDVNGWVGLKVLRSGLLQLGGLRRGVLATSGSRCHGETANSGRNYRVKGKQRQVWASFRQQHHGMALV